VNEYHKLFYSDVGDGGVRHPADVGDGGTPDGEQISTRGGVQGLFDRGGGDFDGADEVSGGVEQSNSEFHMCMIQAMVYGYYTPVWGYCETHSQVQWP